MIYLSARMSRQAEIRDVRGVLKYFVIVKSRWLDEEPPADFASVAHLIAFRDIVDIDDCDTLVRFSDDLSAGVAVPATWATGGRMWETGYAHARGKRIIIVGGHQTVFDYLPNVEHVKNVEELIKCVNSSNTSDAGVLAVLQHARQLCQQSPESEKSSPSRPGFLTTFRTRWWQ